MATGTEASVRTLDDVNPANGECLASIPIASESDVRAAVARARAAQPAWGALELSARLDALEAAAKEFEQPALVDELARLITAEMGKPIEQARREAQGCAGGIRRLSQSAAEALAPELHREGDTVTRLTREALGVVAAITPWNFPLGMAREVIVPALVAGNSVVFKPSELVPLSGAALAEVLQRHLPAGVVELVQGDEFTGKALVAAEVDLVGFVGSVAAGKHIMAEASKGLKRLVLELGGKDPMIVCADADLEAAADFAVRESMRNTGQVCCSVERIYVEQPAAEKFAELVVQRAQALTVGDGNSDVFMGPMATEQQRAHVLAQIEDARAKGARVLLGGGAREGAGWFMEATVVADTNEEMALLRDETFGPVATLRTVDSAEEALRLANDSCFGLGASVWAGDLERGRQLAARVESGMVGVNRGLGGAGDPPWAGAKQSGFGFLGSPDGYRQFTRPLSVSWNEPAAGAAS